MSVRRPPEGGFVCELKRVVVGVVGEGSWLGLSAGKGAAMGYNACP